MRSFLTVAGLALYTLSSLSLSAAAPAQFSTTCGNDYCQGTRFNDTKYYCYDIRLGLAVLPQIRPLDTIVAEYDRLGGLCPGEFIQKWWNFTSEDWKLSPNNGTQLDIDGKRISGKQKLPVGLLVDRFGWEGGEYFAPAYTPYSQRSIPPQKLDTPETETSPTYPCNYHVYKVIKSFEVTASIIAPFYGQPGQGTQYNASSISTLIDSGYLERVNLHEKRSAEQFKREVEEQRRRSLELDI